MMPLLLRTSLGVCLSLSLLLPSAHAQTPAERRPQVENAPASAVGAAPAGAAVQIAALLALVPGETTQPLDLDVSAAQLQAQPQALAALQEWVGAGGVILLHTDAAQVFGIGTQPLRPRTREFAGQEFGRAVGALPFGAHPLLWAGTSQSLDGQSSGFLGVRTVFYRLRPADKATGIEGDVLVNDLGAGVPILRVSDVAPNPAPLYAAVALPYGRGLALFCPRNLETNRADGAQFESNLRAFAANIGARKWLLLPSDPVRRAFDVAAQQQTPNYEPLTAALQDSLTSDAEKAALFKNARAAQAGLWLARDEAQAILAMWKGARDDEGATRSAGLLLELGARLALQQANDGGPPQVGKELTPLFAVNSAARQQLFTTQQGGAHENATRWWCGVFALAAAIPPLSTVPKR